MHRMSKREWTKEEEEREMAELREALKDQVVQPFRETLSNMEDMQWLNRSSRRRTRRRERAGRKDVPAFARFGEHSTDTHSNYASMHPPQDIQESVEEDKVEP